MTRKKDAELIESLRAQLEQFKEITLTITYGTSKARDTYGYTNVTVRSFAGSKIAGISGGGFDLTSAVKADVLTVMFQPELQKALENVSLEGSGSGNHPFFCFYRTNEGEICINGASGIGTISKALKLLGLNSEVISAGKNKSVWVLRK